MSKHTFSPGTRVRIYPGGAKATVTEPTPLFDEIPRSFIPVIVDGEAKVTPCCADNLAVLEAPTVAAQLDIEAFTDAELNAELARRAAIAHTAAVTEAVRIVREWPHLTTKETTATQFALACQDLGIQPSVMLEAHLIATGRTK